MHKSSSFIVIWLVSLFLLSWCNNLSNNQKEARILDFGGTHKADSGDYTGAIQDYENAITLDSTYSTAYFDRGEARLKLGDHTGAIQDYSRVIELDPTYATAYSARGITKLGLEDYQGAIQDFNNAIQLNGKESSYYLARGESKYNLKDYTGAIQDYDNAIQLEKNPQYAAVLYSSRGQVKIELKNIISWCKDLKRSLDLWYQLAGNIIKELCR